MIEYSIFQLFLLFAASSSLFSSTEAAYLSLGRITINRFGHSARLLDRIVFYFIKNSEYFLITILLANLISNITAIWAFDKWVSAYTFALPSGWITPLETACLTFFILLFCEIVPKRIGIRFPIQVIYLSLLPMTVIYSLFSPIAYAYQKISLYGISLFEKAVSMGTGRGDQIDKKELLRYIKMSSDHGALRDVESGILENLTHYKDLPVKAILIPRLNMKGFDISKLPKNLTLAIRRFKYNVIPVYDRVEDNLRGILFKKQLFYDDKLTSINPKNIARYLKMPKIVPENKNIVEVLMDMLESRHEICLVTDEYGGIEGFVTYQDIVKLLLGRMDSQPSKEKRIRRLSTDTYEVNSLMPISQFNQIFRSYLYCQEAETIGGYIMEKIHDIPTAGTVCEDNSFRFTVKSASSRRIKKLLVKKKT